MTRPGTALFTTDADPSKMWKLYLMSFPLGERQHYNCNTCRRFIEQYGGLVTVNVNGATVPAVWLNATVQAGSNYEKAVVKLSEYLRKADITGVFVSSSRTFGHPTTGDWRHMSLTNPNPWTSRTQSAEQRTAELKHNYENVKVALDTWSLKTLKTAAAFVQTETLLFRSEKIDAPLNWLLEQKTKGDNNLLWSAIAAAPNAFCHPRSSVLGTLLDDVENKVPVLAIRKKFAAKMDPTLYQRPQAAPKLQTIQRANKLVEQLDLALSLSDDGGQT